MKILRRMISAVLALSVLPYVAAAQAKKDAPPADTISRTALLGTWESKVDGIGEYGSLELKDGGKFRYVHHDVALGWRTTVEGKWALKGAMLTLTEETRLEGDKPAPDRPKQTETIAASRKDGEWVLSRRDRPEMHRVTPARKSPERK